MPTPRPTGGGAPLGPVVIDNSGNITGVNSIDIGSSDTTVTRDSAGVIAVEGVKVMRGTSGTTDNALLRADGTGGSQIQDSAVVVGDTASGIAEVTNARVVRGVGTVSSPETQAISNDFREFSGSVTVNLLASCTTGREFVYSCTGAGTLTLTPSGSDTVNGGAGGASLAIPCAAGQAVRVYRSGVTAWRAVLPVVPNAIRVYASGSTIYAVAANVNAATGEVTDVGTAVAGTATGTDYSEVVSDGKITIPAGAASTGAVESNSRRYTWTVAELGFSAWTVANPRIFVGTISGTALSDESEARSGTAAVLVGLGTGTSTLIASTGLARTSSGTQYSATTVIGSGSMATGAPGTGAVRASMVCDIGYTSSGNRDISTYNSSGTRLANANSVGITTPSGAPTHVLLMLSRSGTTPSAFSISGLSALVQTVPTR